MTMANATNVPIPYLSASGFVMPTESEILAGVIADIQAAFGGGLNLNIADTASLTTPQGQLATSLTAIIADCYSQFLALSAQVDPQYAQGLYQDALGNIYFMNRFPALGTTVQATCAGLPGTVIPASVPVAQDAAGNQYACAGGTIGAAGSLPLTFVNIATGPTALTGQLAIFQTIPGWDGITGATQTTLGQSVESSQEFEARRSASVAANASQSSAAVRGAVLASGSSLVPPQVPASAYVAENPTNTAATSGGIILPPNSLYVAVSGGNPAAIANAIWTKKSQGCSYSPSAIFNASVAGAALTVNSVTSGALAIGQTLISAAGIPYVTVAGAAVTIISGSGAAWTLSGSPSATITGIAAWSASVVVVADAAYAAPQPAYNVVYTVAVAVPVNIQVTLAQVSNPPSNALSLLQASTGLVTAFSGADGGAPVAQIGATVYGSRFYQTILGILPAGVTVLNVLVGSGSPTAYSQAMQVNQIPSLGNISLVLA
jgi:hypothetical protein